MNNKKYLLRGAHVGFWIGLIIAASLIMEPLLPRIFYKADMMYLITRSGEDISFISTVVSFILYGAILGFLYGKIKNRNSAKV